MNLNRWISYSLYRIANRMMGRDIVGAVKLLRQHDGFSYAEISALQFHELKRILIYTRDRVPYYREQFQSLGFKPEALQHAEEVSQVPFSDKLIVQKHYSSLLAEGVNPLIQRRTGGSTGDRVTICYDRFGLDMTAACHVLVMEWCGKRQGEPEIHFASNTLESMPWQDQCKEYCKSLALNRKNIFIDVFNDERYEQIVKEIASVRPVLVQGYPSTAYALACYCEKKGLNAKGLFQIFEAEGETVYDFQRQKIDSVFGAQVFNRYGNAEFGIIAHECRLHDGLHVRSDMFLVETVPLPESGCNLQEIVVTGLTNFGMPLIRYKTGDLGSLDLSPCSCGLPYPRLRNVQGRVHEMLCLEGVGEVATSVLLNTVEQIGGIRNFQVARTERGIKLFVLPAKDYSINNLYLLQKVVWKNHFMGSYKVDIEVVSELKVSPLGKFSYMTTDQASASTTRLLFSSEMGHIASR